MSVRLETAKDTKSAAERGGAIARQITKDDWLAANRTQEEWERSEIIGDIFGRLLAQGRSQEEADAYLDKTPWEEIQCRHREMYPGQYVLK